MGPFLQKLFELILQVPPIAIVWAYEGGVLMRGGVYRRTLGPGWCWKWPLFDKVLKVNVQEQVVNLANQAIIDRQGRTIAASMTVRYEIEDVKRAICDVFDYDSSLQNFAMSALASYLARVPEWSYDDACETVAEELREEAAAWGLQVMDVWLTDLCPCRAYRLLTEPGAKIAQFLSS